MYKVVAKICTIKDQSQITSFRTEKSVLTKLSVSEFVAHLVDYYEDLENDKIYLVLQNGGDLTLHRLVKDLKVHKGMEFEQIRNVLQQLLFAVQFLHEIKICHRDLKPDNVMVMKSEDGSLKIKHIDFNIAHDFFEAATIFGAQGVRMWSAPETRKYSGYTESCDLWSVGCLLYYMCTGQKLFNNNDFSLN